MTTDEELIQKQDRDWGTKDHWGHGNDRKLILELMSLARQDALKQNPCVPHMCDTCVEKVRQDEAKRIFEKLDKCDRSAPCMECGSVQCAICFKHIEKIKKECGVEE